ncbi:MAG: DUF1800 family protein [Gammaproteobacteria bacterium]|nr:DUF1800 family protein [Gammaproteobacteria bacterium]
MFPGIYDLRLRKGSAEFVVDGVDCSGAGDCIVDGITRTLTVNFPGMASVHTNVRVSDGVAGSYGDSVTYANYQTDQAVFTVFPQIYDLRLRKGSTEFVVDGVNCVSTAPCSVDELTATLTVGFPGLTGVHTEARVADGVAESYGGVVTYANYQTHQAELVVFRQIYDVRVRHAVTTLFDDVSCLSGSCSVMIQGNAQVTLIDGDFADTPLAGRALTAYEKRSDGKLITVQSGLTSPEGSVHFTLPELGAGKIYVLKTYNPYGNGKSYYSPLITQQGPFSFRITRDGNYPLDLIPPAVVITTPVAGAPVLVNGFTVTGTASDNNELESVRLLVQDPGKPVGQIVASLAGNGVWSAAVDASMVTLGANTVLTAIATDRAQNQGSTSISVTVVEDTQLPTLTITSHQPGDQVPVSGFVLQGTVSDDTGVVSLSAVITGDAPNGTVMSRTVDMAFAGGQWALGVLRSDMTENTQVSILLTASDGAGKSATLEIALNVVAVELSGRHLISRITFGATPALLAHLAAVGPEAFLDEQLNPMPEDDPQLLAALATVLGTFDPQELTKEDLKLWEVLHKRYSAYQLREVMAWFWENHFSTNLNKSGNKTLYEWQENQAFRQHALGNFEQLLLASAQSPAMLYYLDSFRNNREDANENYAREVLELHTLGVDGGYTPADIEAAAELFTGWHVLSDAFFFDADAHNPASQLVLGQVFSAPGVAKGEELLSYLARHASTAQFICTKLVRLFVAEEPQPELVNRCAISFQALAEQQADDQIKRVVEEILTSQEFVDNYRNKVKTPLEFVTGVLRALEMEVTGADIPDALDAMGMALFEHPSPDGFSEMSEDWMDSEQLKQRIQWVNTLVRNSADSGRSYLDPVGYFNSNGYTTVEGIVAFLSDLLFADDITLTELVTALEILNQGVPYESDSAQGKEVKLRRLLGTLLSYPGAQYQ